MMKVVADRDIPFLQGVLEPYAEVVYLRGDAISASDVRDADAVLTRTRTRCDAALLDGSRVRFIGTATIGFDHIDMAWCAAHGITVATAAGCNARGVLQWVSAALAWLAEFNKNSLSSEVGRCRADRRGEVEDSTQSTASTEQRESAADADLSRQTTLGIVGVGNVGSLVARYAASWGFRVMCSDPPRERAEGLGVSDGFYPLDQIVRECDVLTFHVPLTPETRHMVNSELVAAMKPWVVILNSSRGPVVEPGALREAVTGRGAGRRGFIIDTWNDEPRIDRRVLADALLGTPHIAGYSVQGKANGTAMIVNALAREFGLPLGGAAAGGGAGNGYAHGSGGSSGHGSDGCSGHGSGDWFPAGARRSQPREISWAEMCATMPAHFDIAAESAALKADPERFEEMRDNYSYRIEYF